MGLYLGLEGLQLRVFKLFLLLIDLTDKLLDPLQHLVEILAQPPELIGGVVRVPNREIPIFHPVSYTHLTLPTNIEIQIMMVSV